MQDVLVTVCVVAAAVYAVWSLAGADTRLRFVEFALPRVPWLHRPLQALRARLLAASGCKACASHKSSVPPVVLLTVLAFAGMSLSTPSLAAPLRVTDDTGAVLTFQRPVTRIVSLAPGATEMLFSAGAGQKIVATVTGADAPEAAKRIERIGDANALVYPRLQALKPDVIVAWKDLTNELVIESLQKLKLPIYYVSVRTMGDIPRSVERLAVLAGTSAAAATAVRELDARVAKLPKVPSTPAPLGKPASIGVFYMMLDSPLYTVGSRHVMSDAIARCGGRNIYADIDFPAPIVEFEDIKKRNPDVILMEAQPITARDWRERWSRFPSVKAVANRQLLPFVDTRLNRMGPSAIDAVEGLCKLLRNAPR